MGVDGHCDLTGGRASFPCMSAVLGFVKIDPDVLALEPEHTRRHEITYGEDIVDHASVEPFLAPVELHVELQGRTEPSRQFLRRPAQSRDLGCGHRHLSGDVQSYQVDGHFTPHHDVCSLGIAPGIEVRPPVCVPALVNAAEHSDVIAHAAEYERGIGLQSRRKVCKRADGHEGDGRWHCIEEV